MLLYSVPSSLPVSYTHLDDSLSVVNMPEGYKRTHRNRYLKQRGITEDVYDYFPVGTTRGMNFKFDDYVIFPIIDCGDVVGYVSVSYTHLNNILYIHEGINGALVTPSKKELPTKIFKDFDKVLVGHYHNRTKIKNLKSATYRV